MKQHPLMQAIEIFEREAVEVKLSYRAPAPIEGALLQAIQARDEATDKCLWAIDVLHEAYVRQTAFEKLLPLQAVAI